VLSYCATSPRSWAPWARRRATVSSMSSTANMTRCRPSVLGGGFSGSAPDAAGVWYLVSSSLLWPSGVRIIAMSPDAVESDGAVRPKAFDLPLALKLHPKLGEERDGRVQVVDDDGDVVHPLNGHISTIKKKAARRWWGSGG